MITYPALKAKMGSWDYFIVRMSMRELAESVKLAHDVHDDKTLATAIQRVLREGRAHKDIIPYLKYQEDRFFGSIVVAALGGKPLWQPVNMQNQEGVGLAAQDERLTDSFGILAFNGTQDYYALDGQHRLYAIKALVDPANPESLGAPPGFKNEEVSVIVVMPNRDETEDEFLIRYRRLFGNLNRYAKPMDKATNIIMDEDDAFAIITRRLISEHPHFKWDGVQKESERIDCQSSSGNLKNGSPHFTSLVTLYELTKELLSSQSRTNLGWDDEGKRMEELERFRPSDETLDLLYDELSAIWDGLLDALPGLSDEPHLSRHSDIEEGAFDEGSDFAYMRPQTQRVVAQLARTLIDRTLLPEEASDALRVAEALAPLGDLNWELHGVPWRHVLYVPTETDEVRLAGDMTRWKMRGDERRPSNNLCMNILRWQLGIDTLDADGVNDLRGSWEQILATLPIDEGRAYVDGMWAEIEAGVLR